ncbi:MAG: hypothetical protein KME12_23505 [Trichocoleus desertorum ATA4-8-CV12]|nr:hypothetical protein [Trichocoleus desertorum ATA4-8-CV12]
MLKSLRRTVALSVAFIPLAVSLPGVAIAEERKVYTSAEGYDVYIDSATIIFNGSIREFVQKNVPWEGSMVTILEQSVNCSTDEIATKNTRRENLAGTVTSSSGRVGQFRRPKAGTEEFLVEVICGLEQPSTGASDSKSGVRARVSDRTSGFNSTLGAGYSPVANRFDPPICFMQNQTGQMFDLTGLCGSVGSPVTASFSSGGFGGNSVGNSSSGGAGSGPCDTPDDVDSAGRRCGARAASERAGGR